MPFKITADDTYRSIFVVPHQQELQMLVDTMKSRITLFMFAILSLETGVAATQTDPIFETIDTTVQNIWMDQTPGIQVGIWSPGQGNWVFAKGLADTKSGKPMRVGMQQPIGSITKTLTGTLILQLVESGAIYLSDPLSKWYPEAPDAEKITIAMLLNMSSGIASYTEGYFETYLTSTLVKHPHFQFQHEILATVGLSLPRAFRSPGEDFHYSNTNTVLLGEIAEKTTGKSYARLLQERIFKPLGMKRTFLDEIGGLKPPFTQTYLQLPDGSILTTTQWSGSWGWSAGAAASTLDDLHRWAMALGTGNGVLNSVTQNLRDKMCAPKEFAPGTGVGYCLGTVVSRNPATGELISYWHNGKTFGASAWVGYFPQTGTSMAIMANGYSIDVNGLAAELQKALPQLFVRP